MLIAPNRVHEYGAYAFRNLKSGIPGPVHLDFPGEVARARFTDAASLTDYYGKEKYRTESRPCASSKEVQQAADLITKAQDPVTIQQKLQELELAQAVGAEAGDVMKPGKV